MYKTREARRIAQKNGWYFVRKNGDHWIYKHPNDNRILTIAEDLNRIVWEKCVKKYNIDLNV